MMLSEERNEIKSACLLFSLAICSMPLWIKSVDSPSLLSITNANKGHGHSCPLQGSWLQAPHVPVEPSHSFLIWFLLIVGLLAWMSLLQKSLSWPPDQIRFPTHTHYVLLTPVFLHSTQPIELITGIFFRVMLCPPTLLPPIPEGERHAGRSNVSLYVVFTQGLAGPRGNTN